MTGGGKKLKNHLKSICYLSNIFKKLKNLYKILTFAQYDKIRGEGSRAKRSTSQLLSFLIQKLRCVIQSMLSFLIIQKLRFRSANCGVILIEFAFCMPILIILLFYINDLVKIKRYYSQTEFVAQQFANIIQNISQKRENKKITVNDLKYTVALAYQTIYPGKTMFWQGSGNHFVHIPHPIIYYVKGNNDGTATTVWGKPFWTNDSPVTSPATIKTEAQTSSHDISLINMGTNLQPSQIYQTLKINPGEVKIIVEAIIFFKTTDKDTSGKSGYTARDVFGCRSVSPKLWFNKNSSYTHIDAAGGLRGGYFNSVVIFTPKPGLFDETAPTES